MRRVFILQFLNLKNFRKVYLNQKSLKHLAIISVLIKSISHNSEDKESWRIIGYKK